MATDRTRASDVAAVFAVVLGSLTAGIPDGRAGRVIINEPTENLLHGLRESPASLVELVEAVRRRPPHVVDISAEAIIGWRTDDPRAWELVLEWLTAMGVDVNVN